MRRLPFRLPEFAPRTTWASARAREVWEPRIQAVSQAWLVVERESVAVGIRPSALQNVTPDDLPAMMKQLASVGLIVLPLGKTTRAQGYQSASQPITGDWDYRCAITEPENAEAWAAAWDVNDNDTIGRLLGTPKCCRDFFERIWIKERWMDTTWPMSLRSDPAIADSRSALDATGPELSPRASEREARESVRREGAEAGVNMLWRWYGVRPVSHLPCSCHCEESGKLAAAMAELLPEPERTWHREILSWPVKWTALNGIAEITTPITRTSVTTDAFSDRLEVRYMGNGYPVEGAVGVGFPHRTTATRGVTLQIARPSAQNPAVNGFSSLAAMHAAHQQLLRVAGLGPYSTVLDLGCGDGTLLSRIPAKRRVGIEHDAERWNAASQRIDCAINEDCTSPAVIEQVLREENPDLIIAQRDRNPAHTLGGYRVLSYSYEAGAAAPQLIEVGNGN